MAASHTEYVQQIPVMAGLATEGTSVLIFSI